MPGEFLVTHLANVLKIQWVFLGSQVVVANSVRRSSILDRWLNSSYKKDVSHRTGIDVLGVDQSFRSGRVLTLICRLLQTLHPFLDFLCALLLTTIVVT
jgi:hypothetical protein